MLRLIVQNGEGLFKDGALNLGYKTFEVNNPDLEKLLAKSLSEGSDVKILGIEIYATPKPTYIPPTVVATPASATATAELKEFLQNKHRPREGLMAKLYSIFPPKKVDPIPLPP